MAREFATGTVFYPGKECADAPSSLTEAYKRQTGSTPLCIEKGRQKGTTNPSDGVSVCLKAEEFGYFRDCEEGDVQ